MKKYIFMFVLLSIFISNCSLSGGDNNPGAVTSIPEITPELPTPTPQPKVTLIITPTNTQVLPNTPSPTQTPRLPAELLPSPFPDRWYMLQPGTPLATINIPHEATGCSWLGVGGQVFDADTAPVIGLSILVGGTLDGNQVGSLAMTGMETNLGEGGYEVTLADHPIDSSSTVWIQIVDSIGNPLSDKIYFDTYNNCEQNFILVNFVRYLPLLPLGSGWPAYLPLITNQTGTLSTPIP